MHGMINTPMSSITHSHRRKNSGELDVFEATRYFSGAADANETGAQRAMRGDRRSLDMPLDAKVPQPHQKVVDLASHNMDKVKCKQPSSPGGRLASFLNNFFQQYTNSKKSKKPSPSSSKLVKGDHQEESNRRKGSSMSSITTHHESKSCYYSSSRSTSGFRTPSVLNSNIWGDEFRLKMRLGDELNINKMDGKIEVDDDGRGSDASSDLFELKINLSEFGELNSSGLPVYGSTDVGLIRSKERFSSTVAY